jgi:hypothetical protein
MPLFCKPADVTNRRAENNRMPTGKIEEIVEGSGYFKIRTDHDDRTVYEIQNRSSKKMEAHITFTQCENVRLEMGQSAIQAAGTLSFTLDVPPSQTKTFVVLYTMDDDLPWAFDYDLTAKESEDPDWL